MKTLRWLLSNQLKISQKQNQNSGFTLIELLVALLLAFLVIAPLMTFMISILNTDRQEQAKTSSEQEIKAAVDYISRDMQQALYIYDATGIANIKSQIPEVKTGSVITGVPVLAFWKREFTKEAVRLSGLTTKDDSFVYSLVVYYLIKDTDATWSKAARIARWQIKDGILDSSVTTTCTGFGTEKYSLCPDVGFKAFNLSQKGKTLKEKMESWTNSLATGGSYAQAPVVLVDFIDQTTKTQGAPDESCSTGFQTVPSTATITRTGFYACVKSVTTDNRSVAEVYLRGNAQARLTNDDSKMLYNQNQSNYFPSGNIKVQGSSFIFTK